jgi:hypothetical protein
MHPKKIGTTGSRLVTSYKTIQPITSYKTIQPIAADKIINTDSTPPPNFFGAKKRGDAAHSTHPSPAKNDRLHICVHPDPNRCSTTHRQYQ